MGLIMGTQRALVPRNAIFLVAGGDDVVNGYYARDHGDQYSKIDSHGNFVWPKISVSPEAPFPRKMPEKDGTTWKFSFVAIESGLCCYQIAQSCICGSCHCGDCCLEIVSRICCCCTYECWQGTTDTLYVAEDIDATPGTGTGTALPPRSGWKRYSNEVRIVADVSFNPPKVLSKSEHEPVPSLTINFFDKPNELAPALVQRIEVLRLTGRVELVLMALGITNLELLKLVTANDLVAAGMKLGPARMLTECSLSQV